MFFDFGQRFGIGDAAIL